LTNLLLRIALQIPKNKKQHTGIHVQIGNWNLFLLLDTRNIGVTPFNGLDSIHCEKQRIIFKNNFI